MNQQDQELQEYDGSYGTDRSPLLKQVIDAGFNPVGITCMLCEETFIFKTEDEAAKAWDVFKNDGWWYGIGEFIKAYDKYINDFCDRFEESAPPVYWLDNNYEHITKIKNHGSANSNIKSNRNNHI